MKDDASKLRAKPAKNMANKNSRSPRAAKWRSHALNLLLVVVIVAGVRAWQQRDMVSGAAPPLQGVTLTGLPYKLPAQPAQAVLVHFWAVWCPICRAEQSAIADIAHDHPDVITVAMQSGTQEEVLRYMREHGLAFPVVNDPDGSIARAWGVHAVPASFIISPDGQIRFVEVGYTTGIGIRLRLWLAGICPRVRRVISVEAWRLLDQIDISAKHTACSHDG